MHRHLFIHLAILSVTSFEGGRARGFLQSYISQ